MNFVQALTKKRHPGLSQNELGNINAQNLLKAYSPDVDPSKIKQLPGFNVPAIKHDQLIKNATKSAALQAEHGAKILAEQVENGKRVLNAAAEIEAKSAELTTAFGNYQAKRMEAELKKQQANAQFGSAAAKLAISHNQNAYALQSAVDNAQLEIHLAADRYEKVGGF